MRTPTPFKHATILLFLWLASFSVSAHAAINNVGLLDNVLNRYATAASTWAATITTHASWLFWTLTLISMVWTFGMLALRKADIGEFFAEFIRFTVFTGFFWWLLTNGPNFATSIMSSLRTIGGNATGLGDALAPSGIVDIGFDIFFKVLDQSSVWSPVDSFTGIIISGAILIILALIGVNMLLLLISGWILAYAGIFFLGFGGSRWTSDMAINYFKTVLSIAAQLFTMVLLIGIGKSFVDQYYLAMNNGISLKDLGVMLIVAVVLLALVNKVPPLVGGLAMGGGTHSMGGGFGAGTAMSAAAMGAAAVATAGAALAAGSASMAGGAQAVMAAFSKANASESDSGGGSKDFMAAASGGGSNSGGGSGGGSALAAAMGDSGSGPSSGSFSMPSSGGESAGSNAQEAGGDGSAPGKQKPGSALAATGAAAAKVGRVAAGTTANLAQGSWDVAKAKAGEMKDAALERISETTGGKIAAAIKASAAGSESSSSTSSTFDDNSLSAAASKSADADSEVAAFRDRDPNPSQPQRSSNHAA